MRDIGGVKNITGAELAMVLADDTQITVDSSHIRMNGIVLDDSTSTGSQFTIGAAVTGQLTITIMNEDGAYSEYNFRDATAQLTFYGIEDLPEDAEVVPVQTILIGQYNIVDYTYDGSDITLTAYDNLSKFDFPCTELAGEPLTFPITIQDLVIKAARICGVVLKSPTNPIPNGSYTITQKPEQWDTMTWHDVISYCAQLGGTYAKADSYGRVYFDWYNINVVHESYDGGTFNTSDTPYSDGDTLDGGSFDYDGTEASADGGNFDWPTDMHYVDSPYALTIDTDDVYITGFKVVLKSTDNINADQDTQDYTTALYGTEGYVVTISGNPFIQITGQADAVKDFLGPIVTGMWFRPMNATIDEDLSIEAGDQAYVTGLNGDTYQCFVSHVTYTVNASTTFSCDAEPNSTSHKTRFTASDKLAAHVGRVERKLSEVGGIAGNTNQYFWHTETGTDTGAHITEVPQEEWDDPNGQYYHSGGNLLARSNGITVRDGLTELATFGVNGATIGSDGDFRMVANKSSLTMSDPGGVTGFRVSLTGESTSRRISSTYSVNTKETTFFAPLNSSTVTFVATPNNSSTSYTVTKTSSDLAVGDSFTIPNTTVSIKREETNYFSAKATSLYNLVVEYISTSRSAKVNFTGNNNILWSWSGDPVLLKQNESVVLSETVKEQLSGIVLVWTECNSGTVTNGDRQYQFIPKDEVSNNASSPVFSNLFMGAYYAGRKRVYVGNRALVGHSANNTVEDAQYLAGITLHNENWALRYVLGV